MMERNDLKNLIRGSLEIIGADLLLKKINSGEKLVIKHGIDPTGADLHLGHAVNYFVMRRFQDLGHKIVILFGDFTSKIGDPTDKLSARQGMTQLDIEKNIVQLKAQILKILKKESLEFRYNGEWWDKMNLAEFMNIAKRVSATHLFERDMFQERIKLEKPIWTHEFLYPILQGYDSVMLKSDLTIIGNDQKFNELIGRDLQQTYNQDPQALIMMPVLIGTDGQQKMGKTTGNFISLNDTPSDMFGKIMSMPDSNILSYYELLTDVSDEEFVKIKNDAPHELKLNLAYKITKFFNNEKIAQESQDYFINTFSKKNVQENKIEVLKIILDRLNIDIKNLLIKSGFTKSNSEAKQLIKQGAIKIKKASDKNFIKIAEVDLKISENDLPLIIQKGKRFFKKIVK